MKTLKRVCFCLIAILCIVCFLYPNSGKAEASATLTVELKDNGTPLPDAEFQLYRIGSHLTDDGTIVLDEPFASQFSITFDGKSDWDEIAKEIDAFIDAQNVPHAALAVTGANGKAAFPPVEEGLYFVSSTSVQHGDKIYTTLPFLILLPSWNTESNAWEYDVTARPKISVVEPVPTPTPTVKPTPSPTPDDGPHSPRPTALPQTGVDWQPTFWLTGFGVAFLLLCILAGVIALLKEKHS